MASALSDRLSRIVKEMRGQARITETNVTDMLREVRMALLEADVALPVVRDFIAKVKEKALGQEVVGSLTPGQAMVGIVNRELAALMGAGVADINLAAQPGVRYSIDHPEAYVSSNLVGTFNVLEAARRFQPKHLLAASTSSAYGANTEMPFRETDRAVHPLTLYAATKSATELMGHSYSHLFGVPTTFFRFFTVYGPWGRPDMALFKFTKAIMADEAIEVYGQGEMSRDFTFVDDLVEGVVRLAGTIPGTRMVEGDTLSPVAPFRLVNVGGGAPSNLMDYIGELEKALGREAKKTFLPMQDGDVPRITSLQRVAPEPRK